MLDRMFIAMAVIGTLFLLFKLIRVRQLRTAQRLSATLKMSGASQILYFSSAACAQCLGQERILNEIFASAQFSGVMLKKLPIEDHAALARQWGVKTLPTTILLSSHGEVKQINNGLVSTATMLSQLRELSLDAA